MKGEGNEVSDDIGVKRSNIDSSGQEGVSGTQQCICVSAAGTGHTRSNLVSALARFMGVKPSNCH